MKGFITPLKEFIKGGWLWLFIPMFLICVIGRLSVRIQIAEAKVDTLTPKVVTLSTQNKELKETVQHFTHITTDAKTAQIVRFYLNKYFGTNASMAEKVFTCESGLDPNRVHVNKPGLGIDSGVAQINSVFQANNFEKYTGVSYAIGAQDINLNLEYAAHLFKQQGNFSAWVCSKYI